MLRRSLPDISDIVSNTTSYGDTSLHILVCLRSLKLQPSARDIFFQAWSSLPDKIAAERALQIIGDSISNIILCIVHIMCDIL
jgi:hypothetical protein